MKKSMVKNVLIILCLALCLTGTKKAEASGIIKDNSSVNENKLDTDLAKIYGEYTIELGSIEKNVIMDINELYSNFVDESIGFFDDNNRLKEHYKNLLKLKLQDYKELNKIYAEGIENTDKRLYQYKDALYHTISNYDNYNMAQPEVIEKVNSYLILVENDTLKNKIYTRIDNTKKNIQKIISEYKN